MVARLKYIWISFAAILLTFPVLRTYFSFHFPVSMQSVSVDQRKIMSYNVRNFDLYKWSGQKDALGKIIEMIKTEKPAIACFQEFYNADTGAFQTIGLLQKEAGLSNYYFEKTYSRIKGHAWGTAIFSRYPIINHGTVPFDNRTQNSCSYADIRIDTMTFRVFNIHLQSVYLSKQDYRYIEGISENQDVQVKPTKEIVSKLKKAFMFRGEQALDIEKQITQSPYPVIVCGDFNDTPASFSYHILANHLQDAFLKSGWGLGSTYTGFPTSYRIDYIFAGKNFEVKNYRTLCVDYSDHYPIMCNVELKD